MSLVSVGTMAFDAIETPFGKTDRILGGSTTYIGLAAGRYTQPVKTISIIGNDFDQQYVDMLTSHGVDMEGVQVDESQPSFFWAGKYHNDMNSRDTLATELNVLADFDPIIPDSYQDCSYLMLGNLAPLTQIQVIDRLKNRPKLIALDTMNFWMDSAMEDLQKVLGMIDVLIINDEEARQLSGEYSLKKAAEKIMNMGPPYLVIKKGEHGALLFHGGEVFSAPGLPLEEVFDPTGAGDTFAGGFIGYLCKTDDISFHNMKRAIIHGSAMASFCVEKFGPGRLEDLKEGELKSRLGQFVALADFNLL